MIKEVTPQIAALYLGQKCDVEWLIDYKSCGIQKGVVWTDIVFEDFMLKWIAQKDVKIIPYLRRLSSMTEAEAREVYRFVFAIDFSTESFFESAKEWLSHKDDPINDNINLVIGIPSAWLYLLSKGYDIFGLIDAGLAKEAQ